MIQNPKDCLKDHSKDYPRNHPKNHPQKSTEKSPQKSPKRLQFFRKIGKKGVKFGLSEKHTKFEKNLPHGFDVY